MTNEKKQNELIVDQTATDETPAEETATEETTKQENMPPAQGVLIDYEERMTLQGAATFLETIVTKLKQGQAFTLTHAGQTFSVNPTSQVGLEVKYEKKKDGKYKLELELEWREGANEGLTIE